ncbi:MAG: hypothetical protein Q8L48_16435 [Archangium sp.]|nr:hypothetical protein [Archangium sp.]
MDPFVRKLVLRLFDEGAPLSRNRHFHTFDSPEGKQAMRISRRLKALQLDIAKCRDAGGDSRVVATRDGAGVVKVEIRLEHLRSTRLTTLDEVEFELLRQLPGVREALEEDPGDGSLVRTKRPAR